MEQGWDPDVRKYFRKILNSISWTLIWMISSLIAGVYYQLAFFDGDHTIATVVFYVLMIITLFLLVRYLIGLWRKEH